nr:cilia- and flagella-associated protein 45 [Limnephilus lunatus]
MAKLAKLSKVKYEFQKETVVPGTYSLHRPSQCNLKFPKDLKPIHKKVKSAYEGKTVVNVPQNDKWRQLLVPSHETNIYPAVWPKCEYERLKQQATVVTLSETLEAIRVAEEDAKQKIAESEARKDNLKKTQKKQPGQKVDNPDQGAPDQLEHVLKRCTGMKNEEFQGPRLANQIILASKCHAIRDAQCIEKELIKRELEDEERRLDQMMEEDRVAALEKEEEEQRIKKSRRMDNIKNIKKQIAQNDRAKLLEAERIATESIKQNQVGIATQLDELAQIRKKREQCDNLKEILDKCNEENMYFKQLKTEEERVSNERIENFIKQKKEREAKQKADADAIKAAKEKGIDSISKAQKAEKALKEELEYIRNLKIQEEVEKEFRRKEKEAAIRRQQEMKHLKESREQQIADIRRQIAMEISRDEAMFHNIVHKNMEDIAREEEIKKQHHNEVQKHRQDIIKQINDKERERIVLRQRMADEGVALRLDIERQDKLERAIIRHKIGLMREQKIDKMYISEVEQKLAKLKYY